MFLNDVRVRADHKRGSRIDEIMRKIAYVLRRGRRIFDPPMGVPDGNRADLRLFSPLRNGVVSFVARPIAPIHEGKSDASDARAQDLVSLGHIRIPEIRNSGTIEPLPRLNETFATEIHYVIVADIYHADVVPIEQIGGRCRESKRIIPIPSDRRADAFRRMIGDRPPQIGDNRITGCAYGVDMHTIDARAAGESEQRLYLLSAWREAPVYTERERAALAWTEAVTLVSSSQVPTPVFEEARRHFTEAELVNLTWAIVVINGWNRMAVSFRSQPGDHQPRSKT